MKGIQRVTALFLCLLMFSSCLIHVLAQENIMSNDVTEVDESSTLVLKDCSDSENGIAITGYMPEDVELSVKSVDIEEIALYNPELSYMENAYQAYDLSMLQDGTEWQPKEGSTVAVTMDADGLGKEGEDVLVYHVHVNEDGTAVNEVLGPFQIQDGKINFEISGFSYVILIGTNVKITDVERFYTVTGISTNKHIYASGVYYTSDNHAHLLLTSDHKTMASDCKATRVGIDGQQVTSLGDTDNYGPVTKFEVQHAENTEDITNLLVDSKFNYIIDIDLGDQVELNGSFTISVDWNDDTKNGFRIDGMEVKIAFNDGIQKKVYSVNGNVIDYNSVPLGYVPEVHIGDTVIYEVSAANAKTSTQSVTVDVTDRLPSGIYDFNDVWYQADGMVNWQKADVDINNSFTLASSISLSPGDLKLYYVKAVVLDSTTAGTYTNTAVLKRGTITKESTASVIVPEPTMGNLTISKSGVEDIDENQSFIFSVEGNGICIDVVINGNGSITIQDLPIGTYTVTENTDWSWRYKPQDSKQTITLSANHENKLNFQNIRTGTDWLSGDSFKENQFDVKQNDNNG